MNTEIFREMMDSLRRISPAPTRVVGYASPAFMAALAGERRAGSFPPGTNWRRLKRERRKGREQWLRENSAYVEQRQHELRGWPKPTLTERHN